MRKQKHSSARARLQAGAEKPWFYQYEPGPRWHVYFGTIETGGVIVGTESKANAIIEAHNKTLQAGAQDTKRLPYPARIGTLEEMKVDRDRERLDWLEKQSDGSSWVARQSNTGRGFRLHNTGRDDSWNDKCRGTAREAIDAAMGAQEEGNL